MHQPAAPRRSDSFHLRLPTFRIDSTRTEPENVTVGQFDPLTGSHRVSTVEPCGHHLLQHRDALRIPRHGLCAKPAHGQIPSPTPPAASIDWS
jgi:hypothetical protein